MRKVYRRRWIIEHISDNYIIAEMRGSLSRHDRLLELGDYERNGSSEDARVTGRIYRYGDSKIDAEVERVEGEKRASLTISVRSKNESDVRRIYNLIGESATFAKRDVKI